MKKLNSIIVIAILGLYSMIPYAYASPTVDEIVARANHVAFYQGNDGRAETRMKIVESNGQTQLRQFTILRKDKSEDADQDFFVFFQRPSDVHRTSFLVKKHINSDDDRWLYLPSLDLVKRISSGDKRTSFVGSHFFYEDVSGRALTEDKHTLIETTETHYVIDNVPVDPNSVEFKHYKVWVNKDTFMPERSVYFGQNEEAIRTIESLEQQSIDGYITTTKMKVSDHRTGGYTFSEIRFIAYDIGITDDVFSERSLRMPPNEWLERSSR